MKFSFLGLVTLIVLLDIECAVAQEKAIKWEDLQQSKKGTITVYWFPNSPFGYQEPSGKLRGIEIEIIEGFQKYLLDRHHINLSIQWVKEETFIDVLNRMKDTSRSGVFGVAGFSLSDDRRKFMKFSPSYMGDVAVLVSTEDIPVVKSKEDLRKYLEGATALTAQGTVLEQDLIQMRNEDSISFTIEYTGASEELINVLRKRKKSFGYLSLPVYLMALDKDLGKIKRQNFLTKRYEGRGIGLPKNSDWEIILNEYFASPEFKRNVELIMSQYVNLDLYHFINSFNPENEVSLLNQEKNMQQDQLAVQELLLQEKNQKQIYLVAAIVVVTILLLLIITLFRRQIRNHKLLKAQKTEIEAQSEQILSINNTLELRIKERTHELENKNKALEEYAFITAHKLRAPLASILGLVMLIDKDKLPEEDKTVVEHLDQSAKKLDEIIHSVMDAIDDSGQSNAANKPR